MVLLLVSCAGCWVLSCLVCARALCWFQKFVIPILPHGNKPATALVTELHQRSQNAGVQHLSDEYDILLQSRASLTARQVSSILSGLATSASSGGALDVLRAKFETPTGAGTASTLIDRVEEVVKERVRNRYSQRFCPVVTVNLLPAQDKRLEDVWVSADWLAAVAATCHVVSASNATPVLSTNDATFHHAQLCMHGCVQLEQAHVLQLSFADLLSDEFETGMSASSLEGEDERFQLAKERIEEMSDEELETRLLVFVLDYDEAWCERVLLPGLEHYWDMLATVSCIPSQFSC